MMWNIRFTGWVLWLSCKQFRCDLDTESTNESSTPPPGISGRKVTSVVMLALLFLVGSISYVLACYNSIETARADADESWIGLADELGKRYKAMEVQVAKLVDEREMDMEQGEEFRLAVDQFRGTAIPEKQFQAARSIERLLDGASVEKRSTEATGTKLEEFNECVGDVLRQRGSFGGRFLGMFLQFPDISELELAR